MYCFCCVFAFCVCLCLFVCLWIAVWHHNSQRLLDLLPFASNPTIASIALSLFLSPSYLLLFARCPLIHIQRPCDVLASTRVSRGCCPSLLLFFSFFFLRYALSLFFFCCSKGCAVLCNLFLAMMCLEIAFAWKMFGFFPTNIVFIYARPLILALLYFFFSSQE